MASASRPLRSLPKGWRLGPAAGLVAIAAPLAAYFALVVRASIDVPFMDDYDTVVGCVRSWLDAGNAEGRLRVLFQQHNEHVIALPRLLVLAVHAAFGRVSFAAVNLVGNLYLPMLLAVWLHGFRREEALGTRWLPFAPVALVLVQPQFWSGLAWPTTSLANFGVVAWAALALAALAGEGGARLALALAAALAATFSQGNGILVLPAGLAMCLGLGRGRRALHWSIGSAALLALYAALYSAPVGSPGLRVALERPLVPLRYLLNFAGCAPAFSVRGLSLATGAALLASFALLLRRGLARRQPVAFGLFAFVIASMLLNALVRAHQGPNVPLLQPRYRYYSTVLLALSLLAWTQECVSARARRLALSAGLALALPFSAGSFALYSGEGMDLKTRLADGLERWWTHGDGGLLHPDFVKADAFLLDALQRGILRPPPAFERDLASAARTRELPEADGSVALRIGVLRVLPGSILVAGHAVAGSSAEGQEVEIVLAGPAGRFAFAAHGVPRLDIPARHREAQRRLGASGFHALLSRHGVPEGSYRLGVLVRQGGREQIGYRAAPLRLGGG